MKSFSYTVKDELGLHARPAGLLVKEVKNFQRCFPLDGSYGNGSQKRSDCDCKGRRRRRRCSM